MTPGTLPRRLLALIAAALLATAGAAAADWPRFRGPEGRGCGESAVPLEWSAEKNLLWKTALPGPGSSSPVVHGDDVFVTCYSGYGVPDEQGGTPAKLVRHLVCIDRTTGAEKWRRDVAAELPEDAYEGYLTEHGYASSTPVVDADAVYAFFGKSGVVAFDRAGKELWRVAVGNESSNRRWGSAASLIRHDDLVIVNAAEESQSIRGLDRKTGREVWKAEAAALELAYGTPAIVRLDDGREELVVAVPAEVWGLDPATGKIIWYATHSLTGNLSPSVLVDGDVVYVFGGFRSAGSLAVRAGGSGDVTKSHLLWKSKASSYVATPLLHEGHLYWIDDRGQAFCSSAKTGEQVYRSRVAEISGGGRPVYASPVLAAGRLIVATRFSGTLVLPAKPVYEVQATNQFAGDESDFSGTPAIVDGRLYLRSGRFLYCVGERRP
ncbi:MAG: PQQ-binding-like beta-propeller repeat protein [Pirellulales bacterium]